MICKASLVEELMVRGDYPRISKLSRIRYGITQVICQYSTGRVAKERRASGQNNRAEAPFRHPTLSVAPELRLVSAEALARRGFDYQHVSGPGPTPVGVDGKLHFVALAQGTRTARANAGVADEHVLGAIAGDEPVAARRLAYYPSRIRLGFAIDLAFQKLDFLQANCV